MPSVFLFSEKDVEYLESNGYVVTLPDGHSEKVTITPEGLVFLISLENRIDKAQQIKRFVCSMYKQHCFHQIERLKKKETLKPKHVGVLLFFLLNKSIGRENTYRIDNYEDKVCIDRVVQSYRNGPTSEIGETYSLRYYLVEAKRILGDIIYNDYPNYYIKRDSTDYVIESIAKAAQKDSKFSLRWKWLKEAYQANITYIRTRHNSFYSASWELELERRIFAESTFRMGDT